MLEPAGTVTTTVKVFGHYITAPKSGIFLGLFLMNRHLGCPALSTSVIEIKDENGRGTAALKITTTESDPYLRDAPAVKVILVNERGYLRYDTVVHRITRHVWGECWDYKNGHLASYFLMGTVSVNDAFANPIILQDIFTDVQPGADQGALGVQGRMLSRRSICDQRCVILAVEIRVLQRNQ